MRKHLILKNIVLVCLCLLLPALAIATTYKVEPAPGCDVARFSGEGEDFSCENGFFLCPFDAAAGGTSLYEKLTVLRQVREQVLKPSKKGAEYVSVFEKHSLELASLVLKNPELAEGTRDMARILIPIAVDLLARDLDNPNILLDDQDANTIRILSIKFEEKASPELRKEIIQLRWDIEQFSNKTVAEILAVLEGFNPVRDVQKLREMLEEKFELRS